MRGRREGVQVKILTRWNREVLRGEFDDDGGGRQARRRVELRSVIGDLAGAIDRGEDELLTYEDAHVLKDLANEIASVADRKLRVRMQQSRSSEKRGRVMV
jgi:hypothetical protein